MKRLISLAVAAVLMLSAAFAAAEGVTFSTPYFTMELPDGWIIETDDLDKKEGEETLGYFGSPDQIGLVCGAYLVYYEELKDFALWNASEEEVNAYTEVLMEEFEDSNPELIGILTADKIPLVMIRMHDDDGDFLYVDTVTNGYAIQFEISVTDSEGEKFYPITDEYIEQVKTILATFKPAA